MTNEQRTLLRAIFQADQDAATTNGAIAEVVLAEQRKTFRYAPSRIVGFSELEMVRELEYGLPRKALYSVADFRLLTEILMGPDFALDLEDAELRENLKAWGAVRKGGRWYAPRAVLEAFFEP